MKNMNFRTLEDLKAPEELKEKLLAIPQTDCKKRAVIPLRIRMIAAAASFAVITAVSLTLILSMGNNSDLEIKPSVPQPTVPYTEYTGDVTGTDAAQSASQKPSQTSATTPTEINADTVRQAIESVINPTTQSGATAPTNSAASNTSPSKSPTQSATQLSSQPTLAPTQSGTAEPTQAPTQKPTQAPTAAPTVAPTSAPTELPSDAPTERPGPTSAPTSSPMEPTVGETISPEERRQQHTYRVVIGRRETKPITGNIYCMVCDSDGNIVGDQDIFSDEHIVDLIEVNKSGKYINYYVSYCPDDRGVYLEPGKYHYYFYADDYYETGKKLFGTSWLYFD